MQRGMENKANCKITRQQEFPCQELGWCTTTSVQHRRQATQNCSTIWYGSWDSATVPSENETFCVSAQLAGALLRTPSRGHVNSVQEHEPTCSNAIWPHCVVHKTLPLVRLPFDSVTVAVSWIGQKKAYCALVYASCHVLKVSPP